MLFFAFLGIDFDLGSFPKNVIWILFLNLAITFGGYAVLAPHNTNLALAAFMTAAAPTAITAPVITAFVQRKVEYVVASVILTNLASAFVIPTVLPALLGSGIRISVDPVLRPVLIVMLVPSILARLTSRLSTGAQHRIRGCKGISFPLWIANLFIISANASNYLRSSSTDSIPALAAIALISLLLCLINFSAGFFTRRPQVLAGSRAIFGAQESFVRHLDRAGLHQSTGCPGPNVLPPVSPFVQRLAHTKFRTRADQQSAARSPLDSSPSLLDFVGVQSNSIGARWQPLREHDRQAASTDQTQPEY